MINKVFGKLKVISLIEDKKIHSKWLAKCECGTIREFRQDNLILGKAKSCGCSRNENMRLHPIRITHNFAKTKFYRVWTNMKTRCNNVNFPQYKDYGARGIKVCERWDNFENFYEDMYPTYIYGLSIERINNNRGYSKKNCKWATNKEQQNNTRKNICR